MMSKVLPPVAMLGAVLLSFGCGGTPTTASGGGSSSFEILPQHSNDDLVTSISADGTVITGNDPVANVAFYWIGDAAPTVPTVTSPNIGFMAYGITPDSSALLGIVQTQTGTAPARLDLTGGVTTYAVPATFDSGTVSHMNAGGTILLGDAFRAPSTHQPYIVSGGTAILLPELVADSGTSANDMAEQSFVVVGQSNGLPVRWTGVASPIASALSSSPGTANGVSDDGSVIVGTVSNGTVNVAFRWTSSDGVTNLPLPAGATDALGVDVSGDGSVVVGNADTASGSAPFVWTAANGTQLLSAIGGFGATPFGGLTSVRVLKISRDGKTVVGTGLNSNGVGQATWKMRLP